MIHTHIKIYITGETWKNKFSAPLSNVTLCFNANMHLVKRNPISYHSSKNGNSSNINNQSNNNLILIVTVSSWSFYQANTQYAFTMSCSIKSYLRHYKTSWFLVTTKAGRQEDEEREAQQHYSDCPSTKQQGCHLIR